MAVLEKTQKVLKLEPIDRELRFSNLAAIQEDLPQADIGNLRDATGRLTAGVFVVTMTLEEWDDLGRPEQITVTVEPGDTLN